MQQPEITQLAPNEFRFEYKDTLRTPMPRKGDKFTVNGKEYTVTIAKKGIVSRPYTSYMVVAE